MARVIEMVSVGEMVRRYVERQDATPELVMERLGNIRGQRQVSGWMLLECAVLDSSMLGSLTILPYGPGCTFKEVPEHPISPRGLASDMSVVVAVAEEAAAAAVEVAND